MNINLVIADDHPLILSGLVLELEQSDIKVVATAQDGREALDAIRQQRPDVALLDLKMPLYSGVEVARACLREKLPTRIVLLSYLLEPLLVDRAERDGIRGYLLKDNPMEVILNAIRKVAAGGTCFDPKIEAAVASELDPIMRSLGKLSPTEVKILRLLAKGYTSRKIAALAFVSSRTVEKHRSNIARKISEEVEVENLASWVEKNQRLILLGGYE